MKLTSPQVSSAALSGLQLLAAVRKISEPSLPMSRPSLARWKRSLAADVLEIEDAADVLVVEQRVTVAQIFPALVAHVLRSIVGEVDHHWRVAGGEDPDELLRRADLACIEAKQCGTCCRRADAAENAEEAGRSPKRRRIAVPGPRTGATAGLTGLEVAERRMSEQALRTSEDRYALAVVSP